MAKSGDHYKKYQVYFFLYLAVICELLIIIVERDDAEAAFLKQLREMEELNRRIILELLKNMPAVNAAGDNQLKVNESRYFTIRVKGLGESDEVTTPPVVHVYKEGVEHQTLRYPEDIRDSTLQSTTGERVYRFNWKADQGPGKFEFWVEAGTNRIELRPELGKDAKVKVGSLEFTRDQIQKAIDFDNVLKGTPIDAFIRRSESLDPAKFIVEVTPEQYEQLTIKARDIVTAVGYPTVNQIEVEGTTIDKVTNMPVIGGGTTISPKSDQNPDKTRWAWVGTFNEAGDKSIQVDAYDNRNAGPLSRARPIKFNVVVKNPYLGRPKPAGAFIGESFEMYINVHGLEDVGSYRWNVSLGGQQMEQGTGNIVRFKVPADAMGKAVAIKASYKNKPYLVYTDSTSKTLVPSEFSYNVSAPIDHLASPSFSKKGEYPINNVFQFIAVKCGRCASVNYRNIPQGDIRIEAETADGQDLLDQVEVSPRKDPNTGNDLGSLVKFYLKGKVGKDGTDATIKVRFGSVNEKFDVILFPAE